jgi:hypothetical protein
MHPNAVPLITLLFFFFPRRGWKALLMVMFGYSSIHTALPLRIILTTGGRKPLERSSWRSCSSASTLPSLTALHSPSIPLVHLRINFLAQHKYDTLEFLMIRKYELQLTYHICNCVLNKHESLMLMLIV